MITTLNVIVLNLRIIENLEKIVFLRKFQLDLSLMSDYSTISKYSLQ